MSRNYNRISDPSVSDLAFMWDESSSDWRLCTLGDILTLFESNLTVLSDVVTEPVTQYSSPATGFSITLTDGDDDNEDIRLILTPIATLATGTLVFPLNTSLRDHQKITVTSVAEITALTLDGNGATLQGGPSTIAAGGYFTMQYDSITTSWYRVG